MKILLTSHPSIFALVSTTGAFMTGENALHDTLRMQAIVGKYRAAHPRAAHRVAFFNLFEVDAKVGCDFAPDGRHYNLTFSRDVLRPALCQALLTLGNVATLESEKEREGSFS